MSELARRYAAALYAVMKEEPQLCSSRDMLKGNSDLWDALQNPCIAKRQKIAVLSRIWEGMPEELFHFYCLLCRRNRLALLDEIVQAYHLLVLEDQGICDVVAVCAYPLTEKQLDGIRALLCQRFGIAKAVIRQKQDISLIGGFILCADGQTMDLSVRGMLRNMQHKLQMR